MHVSKGIISSESSFTLILFKLGFETFTGDCCRSFATSMGDKTVVEDILDNFLGIDFVGLGSSVRFLSSEFIFANEFDKKHTAYS